MFKLELYAYLAIIIASLIIEASTATLVAIWFIPGAIAGAVLSILGASLTLQIVTFFSVSLVLMLLLYKKLRDIIAVKNEKTGIDALIGKEAVAEEDIDYLSPGRVKVNGMSWSAYIEKDDEPIKKGELVTVSSINGVKLYCTKTPSLQKSEINQTNH